jgi:hypothetical protein
MMANGDGFGSVPLEEIPEPPEGSFGELFAKVEGDRAQVHKILDESLPLLGGLQSRRERNAEALATKGRAIVAVWESTGRNLTLATAVRRAEEHLGLAPGCDDPEGRRAGKRGRKALKEIGMKWVRGKGPQSLVP